MSMLPTKVEIKLKKAEAISWGRMEYPIKQFSNGVKHSKDSESEVKDQNTNSFVESVDLEDLWSMTIKGSLIKY